MSTAYKSDTPAEEWAKDYVKHALDELFNATTAYRTSNGYYKLIQFVRRFRFYSPYNGLLIHVQRPGAVFVAPAHRWAKRFGRSVRPDANPIVILQPMGPVMFVFDVSDTEEGSDARPLPPEVYKPFETLNGYVGSELKYTVDNALRNGIKIYKRNMGSQAAGSIRRLPKENRPKMQYQYGKDRNGNPKYYEVDVGYDLVSNLKLSREARYATVAHELAHLYCGHLGTPNKKWWPDRNGLHGDFEEFEAESVAYLVCARLGIQTHSASYLANYIGRNEEVPRISLECVMKAAGLIENMGKSRLQPRDGTKRIV